MARRAVPWTAGEFGSRTCACAKSPLLEASANGTTFFPAAFSSNASTSRTGTDLRLILCRRRGVRLQIPGGWDLPALTIALVRTLRVGRARPHHQDRPEL